jgi:hypothetical protein
VFSVQVTPWRIKEDELCIRDFPHQRGRHCARASEHDDEVWFSGRRRAQRRRKALLGYVVSRHSIYRIRYALPSVGAQIDDYCHPFIPQYDDSVGVLNTTARLNEGMPNIGNI